MLVFGTVPFFIAIAIVVVVVDMAKFTRKEVACNLLTVRSYFEKCPPGNCIIVFAQRNAVIPCSSNLQSVSLLGELCRALNKVFMKLLSHFKLTGN